MGTSGAIIMGFFGAVFAALTLYWEWGVASAALGTPFLVFAVIAMAAAYVVRLPGEGVVPSAKVGRVIGWSSAAEGMGLFVAANVVMNLHRPDLLLPVMALVVGLHFLPIARAAAFGPFYALGGALIAAAALGVVLPRPVGGEVAGVAAALSLWAAAGLAVRRDWRAKAGSASPIRL